MKIHRQRFNIYLLAVMAACLVCGCRTAEGKRRHALSVISLCVEVNRSLAKPSQEVAVPRSSPIRLFVQSTPALGCANLVSAEVRNDPVGGFEICLEFDRQGKWILEQESVGNKGRRCAIYAQWGEAPKWKLNEGRWIAAPKFTTRIQDGKIYFTPDATREEAEQLVLGLNNVAKITHPSEASKW
jgi:hypothetical protein